MKMMTTPREAQYKEFFMNPKGQGGRRHLRLGASSVMDEIIMGRDTDNSGEDPHREFMGKFGDHAGLKSGEETARGRRHGQAMASEMDTIVFGRDMDGCDHRTDFLTKFADHAGMMIGGEARATKKGGYSMASTMDSVVWGRDFDQSGADVHGLFQQTYKGCAGKPSANVEYRAAKKLIVGAAGSMDEILTGRDIDGSDDPWQTFRENNKDTAGVNSMEKPQRPCKKIGLSMQSSADAVIWGRDLDGGWAEGFEDHYGDCAGARANRPPKSVRRAAEALKSSRSEPNLASTIKPKDVSEPKEDPKQQPPAQATNFNYSPPARGVARSDTGVSESPNTSRLRFPNRSPSAGAVTGCKGSGSGNGTPPNSRKTPSRSNSVGSIGGRPAAACYARSPGSAAGSTASRDFDPTAATVRYMRGPGSAAGSATSRDFDVPIGCGGTTAREIGSAAPTPGRPQNKPPSRTGSAGSCTSRDYGACYSPASPTEKALAASGNARFRGSRSCCSTASSSAGSQAGRYR